MRTALSQPYHFNGLTVDSSPSIGLVMFADGAEGDEELLKRADMALYRAKAQGRNRVSLFDPSLQEEVLAHARLIADLRQALNHGELSLHYQPVVEPRRPGPRPRGAAALAAPPSAAWCRRWSSSRSPSRRG